MIKTQANFGKSDKKAYNEKNKNQNRFGQTY